MPNARKVTLLALDLMEKEGAYSNIALDSVLADSNLSETDRRFVSALFFGVLDRKITLDYIISKYLKSGGKTPVTVQNAIRMAVYQIMYMDKVPPFAAVNETVKLIKNSKYSKLSGFANAVLRNILRGENSLPQDDDSLSLSIKYSCNEEIIKCLVKDYGIDTAKSFLEDALKPAPVFIKANPLKTDEENLITELQKENIICEKTDFKNAILVKSGANLINTKAYKKGLFHIEDLACQMAVENLSVKNGERVLDCCAAPGGKTFAMAERMENAGEIIACDIYPARLSLVEEGAVRLGIDIIKTAAVNSGVYRNMGQFDAVLCDVPCSGLGVIRRKPEIKYKADIFDKSLLYTQEKILDTADKHLKPGGRLLYSTCTLRYEENKGQVEKFLCNHKCYKLETERTFLPHIDGTDGFYCALLIKSR